MLSEVSAELVTTQIGRELRNLRLSASLTQEELAVRAGLSNRTVSDIECEAHVGHKAAVKYAAALGYDLEIERRYTLRKRRVLQTPTSLTRRRVS
jgi:transcriptional regulator with XRE-family HTH domain